MWPESAELGLRWANLGAFSFGKLSPRDQVLEGVPIFDISDNSDERIRIGMLQESASRNHPDGSGPS